MREIPGLLTAGIIGILAAFAEPRLAAVALLVLGIGIGAQGQTRSFWPLVASNIFWSVGLHVWLTVQPSLTLTLAREGHHGHGLGMMNRYQSLAIMAGLLLVSLLAWLHAGYGVIFALGGLAIALGALFVARIPVERGGGLAQRLVFRPAYWRYYLLMLLDGGRRQVVQTFAVLILVKEFGVPIERIAALLFINNALTMAAYPVVGRWTDRWGERRVLAAYYALVMFTFFTYTRIDGWSQAWNVRPEYLFAVIFAVDNLLFTASIGIQTYIRHAAPRAELSPSLAMGLTWNHVAAVSVPLGAGWIWAQYGYERIFLCGIALAFVSLLVCATLPRHERPVANER